MLPLLHHAALEKSVQCGPVICIISVAMRLMRESSHITSGCFRRLCVCVCGESELFKANQHIEKLDCSSAEGGRRFAGVNYLTPETAAAFFSEQKIKTADEVGGRPVYRACITLQPR